MTPSDTMNDTAHRTDWHMTSTAIGNRVLPAMELLPGQIPNLQAAVLCTADGYNICAMGLDEAQVGKMAALASSTFSLGEAIVHEVRDAQQAELDVVTLTSQDMLIVGIRIPHPGVRHLVLMTAAQRTSLGIVLMGSQSVAKQIQATF